MRLYHVRYFGCLVSVVRSGSLYVSVVLVGTVRMGGNSTYYDVSRSVVGNGMVIVVPHVVADGVF